MKGNVPRCHKARGLSFTFCIVCCSCADKKARNAMKAKRSHTSVKASATALLPGDVQRRCMHATLNLSNISSVLDGTGTGTAHSKSKTQSGYAISHWCQDRMDDFH